MKKFFYILIISLFLGCTFSPRPACLIAIEARPYIVGEYTCLNKSRDACRCLIESGCDAWVIHGQVRGCGLHAWVEIRHEGKVYWLDPTWGIGCYEKSKWTDRKIESMYKWTGKTKHAKK